MIEHAHTLGRLWRNAQSNCEALRRFQVRKLRALVAHCRATNATYREHWRESTLQPHDIAAPEDICALPTISKDDLRSRPVRETLADGLDPRKLNQHTSSGSSGQPFTVYRSATEEHLLACFRVRAYRSAGRRLSDRTARLVQLPLNDARRRWPGRVREALGIYREKELDGLQPANDLIEQLARYRPDVVRGYPSTLLAAAAWMQEHAPARVRPRLVLCGGELLMAATRRAIEEGFAAPLAEFYGAHEFNLLAWECAAGNGYHVCDDSILVEIVGADGQPVDVGETGEVIATALHSHTMPFVRYRTGDLAVRGPSSCPCGQPFSTLRSIHGRTVEYLRLPDGRRIHPYVITRWLAEREADWVSQHQIVQTDEGRVLLNLRAGREPGLGDLERVRFLGAEILGAGVQFDVTLVDGFPRHPSGKFQPYVSMVGDGRRSSLATSIPKEAYDARTSCR